MALFTNENMLLTELEVVNGLLGTAGFSPISTLDDPNILDIPEEAAIAAFKKASRFVQTSGWWFNNYYNQTLTPTSNNDIYLPANVLKVDATNKQSHNIIQAGSRLKDKSANSFEFTEAVQVDFTLMVPFDELPETAKLHIQAVADYFHDTEKNADTFSEFTSKEYKMATFTALNREHVNANDVNLFGTSGFDVDIS